MIEIGSPSRALANPSDLTPYQQCVRCVMDTTDPDVTFDEDGVCRYCHEYPEVVASLLLPDGLREAQLAREVAAIKAAPGKGGYDCILGLSGGVDSSYIAYIAKDLGLNPLVVHFDNGWNSELAVQNIEQIVGRLGYDLVTFVMDWEEFRDLQRSYFMASVLDLEVPTDHMIFGALYKTAAEYGIKYIISGNNIRTEWMLPYAWYYSKFDLKNLKNIHKAFGALPLKKLPALGVWQMAYYQAKNKIRDVKLLDLIDYNKPAAKNELIEKLEWRDYGGKHYESIFTRFYQGYILPHKWNVDKRKAHLSNLIFSGMGTRAEALEELKSPTYEPLLQQEDISYVAKKLGWTDVEFRDVLAMPNVAHAVYGTDALARQRYFRVMGATKPARRVLSRLIPHIAQG